MYPREAFLSGSTYSDSIGLIIKDMFVNKSKWSLQHASEIEPNLQLFFQTLGKNVYDLLPDTEPIKTERAHHLRTDSERIVDARRICSFLSTQIGESRNLTITDLPKQEEARRVVASVIGVWFAVSAGGF